MQTRTTIRLPLLRADFTLLVQGRSQAPTVRIQNHLFVKERNLQSLPHSLQQQRNTFSGDCLHINRHRHTLLVSQDPSGLLQQV